MTDEQFIQNALENDSLHLYDMAYHNAYVSHPDQEIDYDIIFGRDKSTEKRKEKLRGASK